MGQHRTKKNKQAAIYRREKEIKNLYSLSHVQPTPTITLSQKKRSGTSVFFFSKSFFYQDLIKTVGIALIVLVIELLLWIRLK